MEENSVSREEYIQKVLGAYRQTPGTAGTIRRPDRLLAAQLHDRGVPLRAVENALVLAAARRLIRPPEAPPLGTVRSLAYFSPVIEGSARTPYQPRLLPVSPPQNPACPGIHQTPLIPAGATRDNGTPTHTPPAWMIMSLPPFSSHTPLAWMTPPQPRLRSQSCSQNGSL